MDHLLVPIVYFCVRAKSLQDDTFSKDRSAVGVLFCFWHPWSSSQATHVSPKDGEAEGQ